MHFDTRFVQVWCGEGNSQFFDSTKCLQKINSAILDWGKCHALFDVFPIFVEIRFRRLDCFIMLVAPAEGKRLARKPKSKCFWSLRRTIWEHLFNKHRARPCESFYHPDSFLPRMCRSVSVWEIGVSVCVPLAAAVTVTAATTTEGGGGK